MMWVLIALSSIELLVVHFLLSFWSWTAAAILSAVTLAAILWLVALVRSFKRLPVLVDEQWIEMRVGTIKVQRVPTANVAGVRGSFTADEIKRPAVLNLALIAWPNVLLELKEPMAGKRRDVQAVAHRLDDPPGFIAAVDRCRERRAEAMVAHDR